MVSGRLASGAVLPSEAVICRDYEVSRSVVRDALKVAQEKGIVSTRAGIGTIVLDQTFWSVLDPALMAARLRVGGDRDQIFDDLMGVRIALEPEMAAHAAERADVAGSGLLTRQVTVMAALLDDPAAYLGEDIRFHDTVMMLSGNGIARALLASMADALHQQRELTNELPGSIARAHADHVGICSAIVAGDRGAATDRMRGHLAWGWARLREARS